LTSLSPRQIAKGLLDALTSLKLTIICLALLMILVVACTLAQVNLGTWGAVEIYMRRWLVWVDLPGGERHVPIMPGGALVGLVLAANLLVAQLRRLELAWRKVGLWIAHAGLILLVAGEFVAAAYQVEHRLAFEVGQTVGFVESPQEHELAVIDTTDPAQDEVFAAPQAMLGREREIALPGTPITLRVHAYFRNAELRNRAPGDPPALATAGVGTQVTARELAPESRDDRVNTVTAWVEPVAAGRSLGVWMASNALGSPQGFQHEGRRYSLLMRPRREYLGYSMTLKKFSHDRYPGTEIPKNFSSLVHLVDGPRGEDRDVLIYMNQPLRYRGKTFYQASFGKGDMLSILQVVENPGWLMPYVSTLLVTIGLLVHFAISLRRSLRKRESGAAAAPEPQKHPQTQGA